MSAVPVGGLSDVVKVAFQELVYWGGVEAVAALSAASQPARSRLHVLRKPDQSQDRRYQNSESA